MTLSLPADKSIAHRALLLAALSRETCTLDDVGEAGDVRSTLSCLRALGAVVDERGSSVRIVAGTKTDGTVTLDAGNSGTTARLLAGWLAGQQRAAILVGDASLSRRPMARVATPVNALFRRPVVVPSANGTLPLRVLPGPFVSGDEIILDTGVASAQVKSAVLFAALPREGTVRLQEPAQTRDHTERLLRALGAPLVVVGRELELRGPVVLEGGWHLRVPRDPSAVALLAVAAVAGGRTLFAEDVGLNPTRTAFLDVLRRMGVNVSVVEREVRLGEPVGSIHLEGGGRSLEPFTVSKAELPSVVDEVPALAMLAALVDGESRFEGAGELRLKESDRLAGLAAGLSALGVDAFVDGEALVVIGGRRRLQAASVDAHGDHRLEMAFHALLAGAGLDFRVPPVSTASVSFPTFYEALASLLR